MSTTTTPDMTGQYKAELKTLRSKTTATVRARDKVLTDVDKRRRVLNRELKKSLRPLEKKIKALTREAERAAKKLDREAGASKAEYHHSMKQIDDRIAILEGRLSS